MGDALVLETSFVIDLERERRRGLRGPAHQFLEAHADQRLCLTITVAGELAAGAAPGERSHWEQLLGRFQILTIDLGVCWAYGRAFRYLSDNGLLIGANDLWIAATALANDLPVVTRNEQHYGRVPGLRVLGYLPKDRTSSPG